MIKLKHRDRQPMNEMSQGHEPIEHVFGERTERFMVGEGISGGSILADCEVDLSTLQANVAHRRHHYSTADSRIRS